MENASRAITIAGGVLLSLMVISLLVFGFSRLRNYQKARSDSAALEQIAEYNKQFEAYNSRIVTGYKLVTLAHLTNDINERYAEEDGFSKILIKFYMKNPNGTPPGADNAKNRGYYLVGSDNDYINIYDELGTEQQRAFKELYFECENVDYDEKSGRVKGMTFREITKNE